MDLRPRSGPDARLSALYQVGRRVRQLQGRLFQPIDQGQREPLVGCVHHFYVQDEHPGSQALRLDQERYRLRPLGGLALSQSGAERAQPTELLEGDRRVGDLEMSFAEGARRALSIACLALGLPWAL